MPPLVGAIAAGGFVVASGGTFLGFAGLTAGLLAGASSLALSGLQSLLAPKPKSSGPSSQVDSLRSGSVSRQIRQPITARRMVFGEMRVSGPYAFIGATENNSYLHFIIVLASHEVDQVGEVWVNDDSIPIDALDGNGDVTSGKYFKDGNPYLRIVKMTGAAGQTALSNMTSAFPGEWTSDHRLRSMPYLYIRLKYNNDVYPSGIPNFSAWVRGYKVKDTRTDTTYWHHNPALIARAYKTDSRLGIAIPEAKINDDFTDASANTCEEFVETASVVHAVTDVAIGTELISLDGETLLFQTGDRVQATTSGTLPAGLSLATNYYVIVYQRRDTPRIQLASSYANAIAGTAINLTDTGTGSHTITKNAEPRYTGGGVVDSDGEPQEIIQNILSAMAGRALYAGGKWRIKAGAYETPSLSFDESDLVSGYTVNTKISRRDRFNRVIGTYVSPLNNGQPSDYPAIKNATYVSEDNGVEINKPFDLTFTQRPATAQRLAKILLESFRQEITFSAKFKLTAFKCQIGDNIYLSIARMGWTNKAFEVVEWSLNDELRDGVPTPFIEMKLKETASTIYDWNNGEETSVDPAPNTNLPNPFDVAAPTGLLATPFEVQTAEGDFTYKIRLSWTPPDDLFVTSGGWYEVQFRPSSETDWARSYRAEDTDTFVDILQVRPGITYDARVRSVNNLGVRSSYNSLFGFSISSPSGATITLDYLLISGPIVDILDFGDISDAVIGEVDYGDIA